MCRRFCATLLCATLFIVVAASLASAQEPVPNLLKNGSFEEPMGESGVPQGWKRYGSAEGKHVIAREKGGTDGEWALRIEDLDKENATGIVQRVRAQGDTDYTFRARVKGVEGATAHRAFIQLRFKPANKPFQVNLSGAPADAFTEYWVSARSPDDTTHAEVYVYCHQKPTPRVIVDQLELTATATPPMPAAPPRSAGKAKDAPSPVSANAVPMVSQVTVPVYTKLKNMHIETPLVREGKASVVLVVPVSGAYRGDAARVAKAIRKRTGVEVPIVSDDAPQAALPLVSHVIAFGNRSTNRFLEELYNRYFTLLDLRYPGKGGHVLRSCHNPFGNGFNAILVGGSDERGVREAAKRLAEAIADASGAKSDLALGWLGDVHMPNAPDPDKALEETSGWGTSRTYTWGGFGWNMISRTMALYYMTGDTHYAREFLRYAFPDARARKEMLEIDGAKKVDVRAPLNGRNHYNSAMMILYWDLIEESPVFTDKDRLRVTNAFAEQLEARCKTDYTGKRLWTYTEPAACVPTRHGQNAAMCMLTLSRYFLRDYPDPVWRHMYTVACNAFRALYAEPAVIGEFDTHFWYPTSMEQILNYMLLTGDRKPLETGNLQIVLRGQEALLGGGGDHWSLDYAAFSFFNKAAYLLGEGQWIGYLDSIGLADSQFRVGRSFQPDDRLKASEPDHLVGKWTLMPMARPIWRLRDVKVPLDKSFLFASYRSETGPGGDYLLVDGFYGKGRNPYHTFPIVEMRIAGQTVLAGFRSQVTVTVDGMIGQEQPNAAALRDMGVLAETAWVSADVPGTPFSDWRRTIAQRVGQWALVVDELRPHEEGEIEIEQGWESPGIKWDDTRGIVHLGLADDAGQAPPFIVTPADAAKGMSDGTGYRPGVRAPLGQVVFVRDVSSGKALRFFSLISPDTAEAACARIDTHSVALALPEPAIAISGNAGETSATLLVLSEKGLFGCGVTRAGFQGETFLESDRPIAVAWDFATGAFHAEAPAGGATVRVKGQNRSITLPEGQSTQKITLKTDSEVAKGLQQTLAAAREQRQIALAARESASSLDAPVFQKAFAKKHPFPLQDLRAAQFRKGPHYLAATSGTLHVYSARDGEEAWQFDPPGDINCLYHWPEERLVLVGCYDEKVIALDEEGKKRWEFTSEMDADFVRNAIATHWFKEAHPTHRGIHGIDSGAFIEGGTQAFIGSACTVEILDAQGHLIKRVPETWGRTAYFAITDGAKGSRYLWSAKEFSLRSAIGVLDSRTLKRPRVKAIPFISGSYQRHLIAADFDGDGAEEILCDYIGRSSRLRMWGTDGEILHEVLYKPTQKFGRMIRDVDHADFDGDGKQEIIVGLETGVLMALDAALEKQWVRRMPVGIERLKVFGPSEAGEGRIVCVLQDGTVVVTDPTGKPLHRAVSGNRPTAIVGVEDGKERRVVVLNYKGTLTALVVP